MKVLSLLLIFALASLSDANPCLKTGLRARFFDGITLSGSPVYESFGNVDANFGGLGPGGSTTLVDKFSAIYDGLLSVPTSGNYSFRVSSDDGFRFYLGGTLISSKWVVRTLQATDTVTPVYLEAGYFYDIVLNYFEYTGQAEVHFYWKKEPSTTWTIVPVSSLSTQLCGIDITNPIVLSDLTTSTDLQISLKSPPNCTLTMNVTSPFKLSNCTLTFDNTNYDKVQTITVYNDPTIVYDTSITCLSLTVHTSCNNSYYDNLNATTCIQKQSLPGAKAITYGDPHFVTFDGLKHDFFEIGDYYYVYQTNGELVIQTRQEICATVSCNFGVAVKYRSAIFYVYMDTNGLPSTYSSGSLGTAGITVYASSNTYTVVTASGVTVVISVGLWAQKQVYYLSVEVDLPISYKNQVYGLAGFYDGSSSNDFTARNGTVYSASSVLTFQRSWKVPPAEDLFFSASNTPPAMPGAVAASSAPLNQSDCSNTNKANNNQDFENDNSTSPLKNKTFPDFVPDIVPKNITNDTCLAYLKYGELTLWCETCVPSSSYLQDCITDLSLLGDESVALDAINAYYGKCKATCPTPPPSNVTCCEFCNLHGTCVNGTCVCKSGYTGKCCATSTIDPPSPKDVSNLSGSASCSGNVVVKGTNLFNATCHFGTVEVAAVAVGNFQANCPIPTQIFNTGVVQFYLSRDGITDGTIYNFTYYEACCTKPCQHGSCYEDPLQAFSNCTCDPGYNGQKCDNVNPNCTASTCENGGTCTDTQYGFSCSCPPGFEGATCHQYSNCTTLYVKSYCYDTHTDKTTFCYHIDINAHSSCLVNTITVPTNCNSVSSADPVGTQGSGYYSWSGLSWNSPHEFCLIYNSYVGAQVGRITVAYDSIRSTYLETPYCF